MKERGKKEEQRKGESLHFAIYRLTKRVICKDFPGLWPKNSPDFQRQLSRKLAAVSFNKSQFAFDSSGNNVSTLNKTSIFKS